MRRPQCDLPGAPGRRGSRPSTQRGQLNNLLNNEYETFGTFAPNGKVEGTLVERFLTPAPPINVLAGASYRF
jgi:hypothetical protein